ncbi:MAG: RNA 2'-phosphotransferase, partial [Candidatus Lokiarchaeota archaeon]|nr:RNA 2'-phosphotransferase [Candidatus Lokiarchaeota archaeon]
MYKKREIWISKKLAWILRHAAPKLGLSVEKGGWILLEPVLKIVNKKAKQQVTKEDIEYVVEYNAKRRYSIKGKYIRANQGHSFPVDLLLEEKTPPSVLYHGTHEKAVKWIDKSGLRKMNRNHVHLSPDIPTAMN